MKKHIVCFGDSNTHGYCADPKDCADHVDRFNEDERWTCRLQRLLGDDYLILEEGLSGRTTVFEDPVNECMAGIKVIYSTLKSHEPVDLLIIMLGTNDTKERFSVSPYLIGQGLDRLVCKAQSVRCWAAGGSKILIIAPPAIGDELREHQCIFEMGSSCIEKSQKLASEFEAVAALEGCYFLNAEGIAEFNKIDCMHLTAKGHSQLADAIAVKIKEIFSD